MFNFRKTKELDKKIEKYRKELINVKGYVIQIEKHLKINHSNIVTVCKQNTNRKYAGGYIWRYE